MGLILKKSAILIVILLIAPLFVITLNWHWQPQSLNDTSQYWFWITETATFPWAVITSVILLSLFYLLQANGSFKKLVLLAIVSAFALISGQIIKSVVKSTVAEPRPYVLWMKQEFKVDDEYFYSLNKKDKKAIIKTHVKANPAIPNWLYQHWQHETGYAFPSGHALFAASWAFLALLLLNFRKHYLVISALIIWAILVDISRLKLGMHVAVDLITSNILAMLLGLISYKLALKLGLVTPDENKTKQ